MAGAAPAAESGGVVLRPALRSEAGYIERMAHVASGGFARNVWASVAPGEDPREVGARSIARDTGSLSWRWVTLAEIGGAPAGMLMTSRVEAPLEDPEAVPPMLRPQQELRGRVIGAQHVTFLATLPRFRRRGVGRALLGEAERMAAGAAGLSLIVADGNVVARRLYLSFGFRDVAAVPAVKGGWRSGTRAWVLMVKPVGAGG